MLKATIKIEGMACNMCEAHIQQALRKAFPNIKAVKASHTKGLATFISEVEFPVTEIEKAIKDCGYDHVSTTWSQEDRKGFLGLFK